MIRFDVKDWESAYENGRNIPGGTEYPGPWVAPAENFRKAAKARLDVAYGAGERHRYDLFLPEGTPRGLFVFVHGGYWIALDKSYWSHLAAGAVARGWMKGETDDAAAVAEMARRYARLCGIWDAARAAAKRMQEAGA